MILASRVAACLLVLSWAAAPVWTQDSQPTPAEQRIMDRETSGNGIYVGEPKVYDDSVLVQMLQAASAKLAGMSALDIAGVNKQLGAVTGVNQTVDSLSMNVGGPPTPGVSTTTKGTDVSTTTEQTFLHRADSTHSADTGHHADLVWSLVLRCVERADAVVLRDHQSASPVGRIAE